MRNRKVVPIYIILAAVVVIILVLALGSGGTGVLQATQTESDRSADEFFEPGVEGNLTEDQRAAFEKLSEQSRFQPSLRVDHDVVRFLRMAVPLPETQSLSSKDSLQNLLLPFEGVLNIDNPTKNFQVQATGDDGHGNEWVSFSQSIHGIPVYGASIRIHWNTSGDVTLLTGAYIPGKVPETQPIISVEQAIESAGRAIGIFDAVSTSPPDLYYLNEAVFAEGPSESLLVWRMEITSEQTAGSWIIFVDAVTGEVVSLLSDLQTYSRDIWDNNGNSYQNTDQAFLILDDNGCLPNMNCDRDALNAYNFSGDYANYLEGFFNRDSYDGEGTNIRSYIHVSFDICGRPVPNAAWYEGSLYYSDGLSRANDVVYHEITHGLIDSLGGLIYQRQPGALNESFADIFGVLLDNGDNMPTWQNPNWQVNDWELGEDLGEPIRNLANPSMDMNPPRQPDRMSNFLRLGFTEIPDLCENDSGYVHYNSGIPNKAAYLLIQDGQVTFNNVTVNGIGPRKVASIYYHALSNHINPAWSFRDARDAILISCLELIGTQNINHANCQEVINAFSAVEITPLASIPPNSTPTPFPISYNNTSTLFVFDTSGSMNEADASGMTKLLAAIAAGSNTLDVIQAENQAQTNANSLVGIVSFNYNSRINAALTNEISIAKNALQRFEADGGTGMPDGLKTAIDILSEDSSGANPIIILLSDGIPNIGYGNDRNIEPDTVRQQVLDQATRADQLDICIYTVGFGIPGAIGDISGEPSLDENLLRQISRTAECGSYYNAQSATELANIYVELRHSSTGNILLQQSGDISQGEEVQIASIDVPQHQSQILFTLNWPGSRLEPVLIDPLAQRVDTGYPGASFAAYSSLASIIIQNPEAGTWQVSARGVDIPSGNTTYNAILSSRPSPITPTPTDTSPTPTPEPEVVPSPGFPVVILALILGGGAIAIYVLAQSTSRRRTPPKLASPPLENPYLQGKRGPILGQRFEIRDGWTIGRSRTCQIQLPDPSISRQHARFRLSQGQWFIQDLQSSAGTFVNDRKVDATSLRIGDRIRMGSSEFEFRS